MSEPSSTGELALLPDLLPVLQVGNRPLVDQPRTVAVMVVFVAVVSAAAGGMAGSAWFGGFTALTLLLALWRFWMPVWFELDSRGVQQIVCGRRAFIPWSAVERTQADGGGVLLIPSRRSARLPVFGAVYIGGAGRLQELIRLAEFYTDDAMSLR